MKLMLIYANIQSLSTIRKLCALATCNIFHKSLNASDHSSPTLIKERTHKTVSSK